MKNKHYIRLSVIGFLTCLIACNNEKQSVQKDDPASIMQSYIDSSAILYEKAINEVKQGSNHEAIQAKYSESILILHTKFSSTFDSLTAEYTNKTITQRRYDSVMNVLMLDSVNKRSEELSLLGITFELK